MTLFQKYILKMCKNKLHFFTGYPVTELFFYADVYLDQRFTQIPHIFVVIFSFLVCQGIIMRNNDTNIQLTISAGLNITVNDTIEGLVCTFRNYKCYIECSFHNFFENDNITHNKIYIRKKNDTNTTVDFDIGKQDVIV